MCTAENGPFKFDGRPQSAHCQKHCSNASVLGSEDQLCATVWVDQVRGKESQSSMVESLLVDTRRSAHKNIVLVNSFPPESVERFSKSASNFYVTI
jgi:hypothetical protein